MFLALIDSYMLSVTVWNIIKTVSFSDFLHFSLVERTVPCQFCIIYTSFTEEGLLPLLTHAESDEQSFWSVDMLIADSDLAVAGFGIGEPASKFHICVTLVKLHKTLCISTAPSIKL